MNTQKTIFRLTLVALLCGSLAISPLALESGKIYAATGTNVIYHSEDNIRTFIRASGANIVDKTEYHKTPVTKGPNYSMGSLKSGSLNSSIKFLNQVRYIAGIDADVKLDVQQTELAQGAALINAVLGQLTHYPFQPANMNQDLYDLCSTGAGSSNLGMGYSTLNHAILSGWMADEDSSNIDRVGHRRWVLNPSMSTTGFGKVGAYTAMYSFDRSRSTDYEGVAWPAQNTPVDYFSAAYPWSFSVGQSVDKSDVAVTLKRVSDGKVWTFSDSKRDGYFNVDSGGYGQPGCIIFRPNHFSYKAGDTFEVTITGAPSPISYTVHFFSLGKETTTAGKPVPVKIKSLKSGRAKKVTVKWKANKKYNGYQIFLSTSKNFKNGVVKKTVKNGATSSNTISKLKSGKKYYVKIRAYIMDGKTKIYGKYGKAATVRVR